MPLSTLSFKKYSDTHKHLTSFCVKAAINGLDLKVVDNNTFINFSGNTYVKFIYQGQWHEIVMDTLKHNIKIKFIPDIDCDFLTSITGTSITGTVPINIPVPTPTNLANEYKSYSDEILQEQDYDNYVTGKKSVGIKSIVLSKQRNEHLKDAFKPRELDDIIDEKSNYITQSHVKIEPESPPPLIQLPPVELVDNDTLPATKYCLNCFVEYSNVYNSCPYCAKTMYCKECGVYYLSDLDGCPVCDETITNPDYTLV